MTLFDAEHLWRLALVAVPLTLVVAAVGRCFARQPGTRHALWAATLLVLVTAPWIPAVVTLPEFHWPAPSALPIDGTSTPAAAANPVTDHDVTRTTVKPAIVDHTAPPRRAAPPRPPSRSAIRNDAPVARSMHAPADTVTSTIVTGRGESLPPRSLHPPAAPQIAPPTAIAAAGRVSQASESSESPSSELERRTRAVPASRPPEPVAAWLDYAARLRHAAVDVPAIPDLLWILGSALFAAFVAFRSARFTRVLRSASHAPPEMAAVVGNAARELGLRRAPRVFVVDACISPVIWCGLKPLLIMPSRLWDELDHAGRVAITYHELAHIKRRDHWTCWLSMTAGCLYWWHPAVWWIRRRIRDEADLCCDAWVTLLRPDARRAYATALLETKRYTSSGDTSLPAMALGATTRRARRLARRITMVMTMQTRPGMTVSGAALVGTIALAAWTVVPALACPPEEQDNDRTVTSVAIQKTEECCAPASGRATVFAIAAGDTEPEQEKSTFEQFMEGQRADESDDDRIAEIERRIAEITARIEEWSTHFGEEFGAMPEFHFEMPEMPEMPEMVFEIPDVVVHERARRRGTVDDCTRDRARTVLRYRAGSPEGNGAFTWSTRGEPQVTFVGPDAGTFAVASAGGACCNPCSAQCGCGSAQTSRAYRLPKGQLDALTELMARADVPVLISPGEDAITLHGDAAQHRIFAAFVDILGDEEDVVTHEMPDGRREAFYQLMAREDVPVLISGTDDAIRIHGDATSQRVVGDFIRMISADGNQVASSGDLQFWVSDDTSVDGHAGDQHDQAMSQFEAVRRQYEAQAQAQAAEHHAIERERRDLERVLRDRERSAARQRDHAERLFDRARQLEDEAERFEESAEEAQGRQRERAMARAHELFTRAMATEAEADATEAQADAFEDEAENLEDLIEELEDRIEELMEAIEDLEEDDDDDDHDHDEEDDD